MSQQNLKWTAPSKIHRRAEDIFKENRSFWVWLYLPMVILEALPVVLAVTVTMVLGRQNIELYLDNRMIESLLRVSGQWVILNILNTLVNIIRKGYRYYVAGRARQYIGGAEQSAKTEFLDKIGVMAIDIVVSVVLGMIPLVGVMVQLAYHFFTMSLPYNHRIAQTKSVLKAYLTGLTIGVESASKWVQIYFIKYRYEWFKWFITLRVYDIWFGPKRVIAATLFFNEYDRAYTQQEGR